MSTLLSEMAGTANWAWAMYPGLSHGAHATITAHGTDEQKAAYLGKLTSGEWMGTMCLTESHCGTDLGMLRTRVTFETPVPHAPNPATQCQALLRS